MEQDDVDDDENDNVVYDVDGELCNMKRIVSMEKDADGNICFWVKFTSGGTGVQYTTEDNQMFTHAQLKKCTNRCTISSNLFAAFCREQYVDLLFWKNDRDNIRVRLSNFFFFFFCLSQIVVSISKKFSNSFICSSSFSFSLLFSSPSFPFFFFFFFFSSLFFFFFSFLFFFPLARACCSASCH